MTTQHSSHTACFHLLAQVDPGVMPRVLGLLSKRGLVPSRWHSSIAGPRRDELHIDIEVEAMAADLTEQVAATMRQITLVSLVLTSQKRHAISA